MPHGPIYDLGGSPSTPRDDGFDGVPNNPCWHPWNGELGEKLRWLRENPGICEPTVERPEPPIVIGPTIPEPQPLPPVAENPTPPLPPSVEPPAPIPLPAPALLLMAALMALGAARTRRARWPT